MSLFGNRFTKEGPGVPKNAPPKKGLARFFEIWMRDAGDIWKVNALTLLCLLPCAAAAAFAVIGRKYLAFILIGVAAYVLGALLAGPALCGMQAVIIKMVRDEPGYLMHTYKKAWKDNKRQSRPLGVLLMVLLAMESITTVYFMPNAQDTGAGRVVVFALAMFCLLVVLAGGALAITQLLFVDLPNGPILRNSLLLFFGYAKRTLPAALLLFVCWLGGIVLLNPFVFLGLAVVGFTGLIAVGVDMWLWPVMESAFHISELQAKKRAEAEAEDAQNLTAALAAPAQAAAREVPAAPAEVPQSDVPAAAQTPESSTAAEPDAPAASTAEADGPSAQ